MVLYVAGEVVAVVGVADADVINAVVEVITDVETILRVCNIVWE